MEKYIVEGGIGLIVAYLVIKEFLALQRMSKKKNNPYDPNNPPMTINEHERLCPRIEMWKKISETHDMVLKMYQNKKKRNGDE